MSGARERVASGVGVVAAGILMLVVMGRAVAPLVAALGLVYALWLRRTAWRADQPLRVALVVALVVQAAHFYEEVSTGFYRAFPPLLGGAPWPVQRFVIFNVAFLALSSLAIIGVGRHWRPAYIITLFLASGGGIGNGIGHLLLAARVGGYFPGAYTAPLALIAGLVLLALHVRRPGGRTTAI